MEFITDILKLEGKTIKNATVLNCDDSIALVFTDHTFAFFSAASWGDCHGIVLTKNPDNCKKRDGRIITEKEYQALWRIEQDLEKAAKKEKELEALAYLKAKYEEDNDESKNKD